MGVKRVILILLLMVYGLWAQAQILTDSNLPIVVIDIDGGASIPDEPRVYGNMKVIWHQDGSRNYLTDVNNPAFLNYDGRISIEIRGSSSQMPSKKPYGLTTLQADDITNNNVSILGMPSENDWILNSLAFDQTGLRDVLSYELSERIGQYAPRRVYCEVVINNDYKGLYVFMEKIKVDKDRVNIVKMEENSNSSPEVTGGYLIKTDRTDGDYAWSMQTYIYNWWNGTYNNCSFAYCYPKREHITTTQSTYIRGVFFALSQEAGNHNTDVTTGIPSLIDIPSFVDFMLMGEFSSNVDVYELSTFFHKDRMGKLRAGPIWDYNLAYGHDEFGNRSLYYVWQFDNNDNVGPKFWKDLFDTSLFRCYLARRWFELTEPEQPLNYDVLCARIDEIDAWISEGIGRDNQRWHQMNQHVSEIQSMKTWIQNRIDWLNQNIGSYDGCEDVLLPPLVISKIHYHPEDWWAIDGDQLEFIEISNNGDETVDLTGFYFRELGVTYSFPVGSSIAGREALVLCSDSLAFMEYYNTIPFGQFNRNLSNKSENLVLVDAWGNIIDQVHYYDNDPWPWEADGEGPYLQLIDLDLDNSLPESWTTGDDLTVVSENETAEGFRIYPNPTTGIVHFVGALDGEYRITNIMGQTMMAGPLKEQIDFSRLSAGVYFITIGNKTQKLLVRR